MVNYTLRRRNLAGSYDAGAEDHGALELGAGCFRIYHQARIHSRIHAGDAHFTLIVDFDFNDRGNVRQETSVRGNPYAAALRVFALSPPGFFRDHLRDMSQTAGFPGVGFKRSSVIRVFDTVEIDRARLPIRSSK